MGASRAWVLRSLRDFWAYLSKWERGDLVSYSVSQANHQSGARDIVGLRLYIVWKVGCDMRWAGGAAISKVAFRR